MIIFGFPPPRRRGGTEPERADSILADDRVLAAEAEMTACTPPGGCP